jgi:pimeloyl-ACP methyl ester carboxylesterase
MSSNSILTPNDSSTTIAHELHSLVHNANLSTPFTFVGWSFGGYVAMTYAQYYAEGIVLAAVAKWLID